MTDKTRLGSAAYQETQTELITAWEPYLKKNGRGSSVVITDKFTTLLHKGIPDRMRGQLWLACSGGLRKLEANPGFYSDLLLRTAEMPPNESVTVIDRVRLVRVCFRGWPI